MMCFRLRLLAMAAALTLARCGPEPLALVLASQASPAWAFATAASSRYTVRAVETTIAGFGDSVLQADGPPQLAVFFRPAIASPMGRHGGRGSPLPGTCSRFANLPLPPHPFGDGGRFLPLQEPAMRASASARPEQTQLPEILAIVRTALRDAVSAPTDRESLDVAGAALVAVADRVRALQGEVHRG